MGQPRITWDEVKAARDRLGMRCVYSTFGGDDCGCPQTLLYYARGHLPRDNPECAVLDWATKKYGLAYAVAFRGAFDTFMADGEDLGARYGTKRDREGHEDGLAVAVALQAELAEAT